MQFLNIFCKQCVIRGLIPKCAIINITNNSPCLNLVVLKDTWIVIISSCVKVLYSHDFGCPKYGPKHVATFRVKKLN